MTKSMIQKVPFILLGLPGLLGLLGLIAGVGCGGSNASSGAPEAVAAPQTQNQEFVFSLPRTGHTVVMTAIRLGAYRMSSFDVRIWTGTQNNLDRSQPNLEAVDPSNPTGAPLSLEIVEWMDMGAQGGHPGNSRRLVHGTQPGVYTWSIGFTMPGQWTLTVRFKRGTEVVDEAILPIQVPG